MKECVLRFESSEEMIHEDIWGRAFQQKESQTQMNWNVPECLRTSKETTVAGVVMKEVGNRGPKFLKIRIGCGSTNSGEPCRPL